MSSVEFDTNDEATLNNDEQWNLLSFLKEIKEDSFKREKVCPHCNSNKVWKHGKSSNRQRYICKACGKTFSDLTQSPMSSSKKSIDKWLEYAKCIDEKRTIRETAKIVGINIATAFFWRHKILDGARIHMGVGYVEGVVQAGETYFNESFKGNHVAGKHFQKTTMVTRITEINDKPREQICVEAAVDDGGSIISELICKGKMKSRDLKRLFKNRLGDKAIFCTNSNENYNMFAKDLGLKHYRARDNSNEQDFYNTENIDFYLSCIQMWINRFRGVATKYLYNYLYWLKWISYSVGDKECMANKTILSYASTVYYKVKIADYRKRLPIFI